MILASDLHQLVAKSRLNLLRSYCSMIQVCLIVVLNFRIFKSWKKLSCQKETQALSPKEAIFSFKAS